VNAAANTLVEKRIDILLVVTPIADLQQRI